ncbi:MAG: hypothetical protein ACLFUS_12285, partial [Candidatus Sumerlaeia bacterium]
QILRILRLSALLLEGLREWMHDTNGGSFFSILSPERNFEFALKNALVAHSLPDASLRFSDSL